MKSYYDHAGITIYHGDCREILPTLDPVDLILTDPPYGLGDKMKGGTWGNNEQYATMRQWDKIAPDVKFIINTNIPSIIWGGNYFVLPPSRCWISWSKTNAVATMAKIELAWTSFDRPSKEWRGSVGVHDWQHPTQKPLDLFLWCIKFSGDPQTILDPFMGSGTTLRAAKELNKKAIGIELEERYCEIAANRMCQEVLEL